MKCFLMGNVYLIRPSGFCMGVERAVNMLNDIVSKHSGEEIYCIHEIVHNPNVVNYFKNKGVRFVEKIEDIKNKNSIVVFSAHGIDKFILNEAKKNFKKVYNLVCPLVEKVYNEGEKFIREGKIIFYIGKKGHQEAENIISYFKNLGGKVYIFLKPEEIPVIDKDLDIGILNQTTLNFKYVMDLVNKIKVVYKNISLPPIGDVCKATFDRQRALKDSLDKIDILIVIGGKNSSNTKELVNIGKQANKETYHIESVNELKNIKIDKTKNIGITAGASTPWDDIRKVFDYLRNL